MNSSRPAGPANASNVQQASNPSTTHPSPSQGLFPVAYILLHSST